MILCSLLLYRSTTRLCVPTERCLLCRRRLEGVAVDFNEVCCRRGGNADRPTDVLCAVALTRGMLIAVARIVVDSVTLATCLVFGSPKSWAEHALSAAAGRPSTSTTRRVAPRHHDHRRQPPTAATARLLRDAKGRQGDKEASARPFGMCRRLQALVCGRLRPIASGVCGALPCLQRKRRSLPLRVLQLRPHRRDPLHPNHPNPNPHRP